MTSPLTPSEELTHSLCKSSFLSLWCYNNPRGKKGKELCDVLVVCDPDVVVFSVKDINLGNPDDPVHVERWRRRAIEESITQLIGAERWLSAATQVVQADGTTGIDLPDPSVRRTHRVAVACGSRASLSIASGFQDGRFTHVFTENDLTTLIDELDTITDFVGYLTAKESFLGNAGVITEGTESDLLALYLSLRRAFPEEPDMLIISEGCWDSLQEDDSFLARKKADAESYRWDDLIEMYAEDSGHDASEHGLPKYQREQIVRQMAREDRFCRRKLVESMQSFFMAAKKGNTRARILLSPSLVVPRNLYVLIRYRKDEKRAGRMAELYARCLIALTKVDDAPSHVLGLGFGESKPGIGSENDLLLVDVSKLDSTKWRTEAEHLESELGYFKQAVVKRIPGQEFPNTETD